LDEDSAGPKEPCIRWECISPRERGNFRGLSFKSTGNLHCSVVAAYTATSIIQSPIASCSRRDHSVCPASANSILKISGRRRCGLSAAKEAVGLHSAGEVCYPRLPCCCCNHKERCRRLRTRSTFSQSLTLDHHSVSSSSKANCAVERCRADNTSPTDPIFCFPPGAVNSKSQTLFVVVIALDSSEPT